MFIYKNYKSFSKEEIFEELKKINLEFEKIKHQNLKLDISRGKPSIEQLDLSNSIHDVSVLEYLNIDNGNDLRNYSNSVCGIEPARILMSILHGCSEENVFVIGNSSLNLMFDVISFFILKGIDNRRWLPGRDKFVAIVPGYDRHFKICEYLGFEMINFSLPKEDLTTIIKIKNIIENDENIKAIWCVPKFSNPSGFVYSDEMVKILASLKPAAKNFRILWDNAYSIHEFNEEIKLLNIFEQAKLNNNLDLVISFTSTSKITLAGSGIASIACLGKNFVELKKYFGIKLICPDKINQIRHAVFFSDNKKLQTKENLKEIFEKNLRVHMQKHAKILRGKIKIVLQKLESNFSLEDNSYINWSNPEGGYFILLDCFGNASSIVDYCKELNLTLTNAGATHPFSKDTENRYIRIAPSFLSLDDLNLATDILIICIKKALIEKALKE